MKEILKTKALSGKTVAMTGCTGGLGKELCLYIIGLGARLIMLDRNRKKAAALEAEIKAQYPDADISKITVDLENIDDVKSATEVLLQIKPDVFIHNAGTYHIPRHICSTGYDNVFQINFVSPYYIIRTLAENLPSCKAVAVGSIAHSYSHIDTSDVDFHTRTKSSKVYGNAKRYLMFALHEYFAEKRNENYAIVHPGITFTNITAHYPKAIFAIIKHPMKIIFMKPKKAALCILQGIFENTPDLSWIGPRLLGIWGGPKKRTLKTCQTTERHQIHKTADEIYKNIQHLTDESC